MIFTGVDGDKSYSLDINLFKKSWKPTDKEGKKIYVIPSDKLLIKTGNTPIKDKFTLRKSVALEIEERFGEVEWDVSLDRDGNYVMVLYKDFSKPEDAYALDAEPFSLLRTALAHGYESVYVLDMGRHKTTLVESQGGKFKSFRVVLKGGDFIDRYIADKRQVSKNEAENLKIKEGLGLEEVKEALGEILGSLGIDLREKPVLLTGGESRLLGIEEVFKNLRRCSLCKPQEATAFGAALMPVFNLNSPDFRHEDISPALIRRFGLGLAASLLLFLGTQFLLGELKAQIRKEFKRAQVAQFKERFPNKPAVAVYDQVRSMFASRRRDYAFTKKLAQAIETLKDKEIKLYSIEYNGEKLSLRGEAKKEVVDSLPVKEVKKTPEGNLEFKMEL